MKNLNKIKQEYLAVLKQLKQVEQSLDWEEFGKLNKQKEAYASLIQKQDDLEKINSQLAEAEKILTTEKDIQLVALAQEEKDNLLKQKQKLEKEIEKGLKEISGEGEEPNAIIAEIRAGAGGEEAALFASALFNMYSKYAESQGWEVKLLDQNQTEIGGFKEVIFQVTGDGAFSKMKNEAGVHRVQRIPTTEKAGRIHTSTASVAVLPKPSKSQIQIKPDEIQIDTYKSSGAGGQNVNKRETAIRITHLPTGLVVTSQTERNQLQNKENALSILQARLLERQIEEQAQKQGSTRKDQIGQAMRAEKIRTYNFPQNRITDHRIKKTWHNLEQIMAGDLNDIVNELEKNC
ncbi:peptide chain release factor 1 [Patescibacteria group bacterium]|nr:peptide chain release factor 1 [Patescibacteria group bacterium]